MQDRCRLSVNNLYQNVGVQSHVKSIPDLVAFLFGLFYIAVPLLNTPTAGYLYSLLRVL